MAIEVFKILHLCPPALSNLVQKRESSYHFRYSNILQIPTVVFTGLHSQHSEQI